MTRLFGPKKRWEVSTFVTGKVTRKRKDPWGPQRKKSPTSNGFFLRRFFTIIGNSFVQNFIYVEIFCWDFSIFERFLFLLLSFLKGGDACECWPQYTLTHITLNSKKKHPYCSLRVAPVYHFSPGPWKRHIRWFVGWSDWVNRYQQQVRLLIVFGSQKTHRMFVCLLFKVLFYFLPW